MSAAASSPASSPSSSPSSSPRAAVGVVDSFLALLVLDRWGAGGLRWLRFALSGCTIAPPLTRAWHNPGAKSVWWTILLKVQMFERRGLRELFGGAHRRTSSFLSLLRLHSPLHSPLHFAPHYYVPRDDNTTIDLQYYFIDPHVEYLPFLSCNDQGPSDERDPFIPSEHINRGHFRNTLAVHSMIVLPRTLPRLHQSHRTHLLSHPTRGIFTILNCNYTCTTTHSPPEQPRLFV